MAESGLDGILDRELGAAWGRDVDVSLARNFDHFFVRILRERFSVDCDVHDEAGDLICHCHVESHDGLFVRSAE